MSRIFGVFIGALLTRTPVAMVIKERWALRTILVFYVLGLPRLFGIRYPLDDAILMLLSVFIVLCYPFTAHLWNLLRNDNGPSEPRPISWVALGGIAGFAVFWILIML